MYISTIAENIKYCIYALMNFKMIIGSLKGVCYTKADFFRIKLLRQAAGTQRRLIWRKH
jgi:hypothetical protein